MEEFLAAEYFGLGAGVWIGIGAGIVVLIVLVIVLLTRAGKSKPPLKSHAPLGEKTQPFPSGRSAPPKPDGTASASPREEVVFAVDFSRDTMEGWQNIKGGEPPGQIVDGWYRLGAAQGARTADTLPVKPGERFRLEWRVRDATESRVGGKYAVGPLFYRENGSLLQWWPVHTMPPTNEGVFEGLIETETPPETAFIALGVNGIEHPSSERVLEFRGLSLSRIL